MSKVFNFKAKLQRPEGVGTWHYVDAPIDAKKEFGLKGKVPVCGKVKDIEFNSTLIPRGNGEHYLLLDKTIRLQAKIAVGDSIAIELWKDVSKREVSIPEDFQSKLEAEPTANQFFVSLAYSYKKGYVDWIEGAKKEETRNNRIKKAVDLLLKEKKTR